MTAVTYELADADGDDYTRLGAEEAELFANEPFEDSPEGRIAYAVEDVGRRRMLAGRTALAGLAEGFHTDRVMPRRLTRGVMQQVFVGSENYLG